MKLMPVFCLKESDRGEVDAKRALSFPPTFINIFIMKTFKISFQKLTVRVGSDKKVKVKAYKRLRNGRIEKVKSHYRGVIVL